VQNIELVRKLCELDDHVMVLENSSEGSETLTGHFRQMGIEELVRSRRLLVIAGGDMDHTYPHLLYQHFLCCVLDYPENRLAQQRTQDIFDHKSRPYDFMFLNGRGRGHRRYLWHRFQQLGLLDRALWTMLDGRPIYPTGLTLHHSGHDLMSDVIPLQWLPTKYEYHEFRDSQVIPGPPNRTFVKPELFKHTWGDIYLEPQGYVDTYFSVVTETVFESQHSFFTEKIAKPLAQGHPWIAVANPGFYRDLRALGFRTFSHVIDESFDAIQDHQTRLERIVAVVQDICRQDLSAFVDACQEVCKYNQRHLAAFSQSHRRKLPRRFFDFIKTNE
jgi:hypothetical protein